MNVSIEVLILVVYTIVETLEKIGLPKRIAHLLAIPFGVALSFILIQEKTVLQHILYGIIVGIGAVGSCDTLCNIFSIFKK